MPQTGDSVLELLILRNMNICVNKDILSNSYIKVFSKGDTFRITLDTWRQFKRDGKITLTVNIGEPDYQEIILTLDDIYNLYEKYI